MADFTLIDDHASPERLSEFLDTAPPSAVDAAAPPTEPLSRRRAAAFRPPEAIARRLDVVKRFSAEMASDFALIERDAEQGALSASMLLAGALSEEALGDFEQSARALNALRRHEELDAVGWRVTRRIARQLDAWELVEESLKRHATNAAAAPGDFSFTALDALERAQLAWMQGAPPERVALLCEVPALTDPAQPAFVAYWCAQLLCDAALCAGDLDAGMEALLELVTRRGEELPRGVYQSLEWTLAAWLEMRGELEASAERLLALDALCPLPHALLDALAFALAQLGQLERFRAALYDRRDLSASLAALRARLLAQAGEVKEACNDVEAISQRHAHDGFLLRVHEEILEMCHAEALPHERPEIEERLVQVLNFRLEASPCDEECVALLLRLGRLYEGFGGEADAAAAEVYREALCLQRDNPAILRALGRVYHRNASWELLAQLYEHEIAVFQDERFVWRRHFEVARLYEERLGDDASSLEHYAAVLAARPHYLPALKAAARQMERAGQWAELADLFLARVATARSARQRLYMLDKVAEIAEQHLQADDVAIEAWREILLLSPEHPRAYAALGRLLSRGGRHKELVELNLREMERMDDPEEIADLYLKNAELFGVELLDQENAELCYRRALQLVPDFVPALKGLGRLLIGQDRWASLVEMIQSELGSLDDPSERALRFGTLAEIAEFQLHQPQVAIHLYETMQRKRVGADPNVFFSLRRLYRSHQRWSELEELLERRAEHVTAPGALVALHTELAELQEWHLDAPERAFEHYRAALCIDPSEPHALAALARLWSRVGVELDDFTCWLEGISAHAELDEEGVERYRSVICRLRVRQVGGPEAAIDLRRLAPNQRDPEHAVMLRLAEALDGERGQLALRQVRHPLHDWETAKSMPRHGLKRLGELPLERIMQALDGTSRAWFIAELEGQAVALLPFEGDEQRLRLGHELAAWIHGGLRCCESIAGPETSPERLRLRALEAERLGELDEYEAWTRREIAVTPSRELQVRRLLELAHGAEGVRRDDRLHDAARAAFPELDVVGQLDETEPPAQGLEGLSGAILDELYEALYQAERWQLLRRALELDVERRGVTRIRKAYLYDMLSDMLERYLDEPAAALEARRSCYALSREPDHVIAMVRLCQALGLKDEAIAHQREFFELLWGRSDAMASRCVEAGLGLAKMLRDSGRDELIVESIERLDALIARFEHHHDLVDARLELARSHASHGDPHRAAELYRRALTPEGIAGRERDWEQLVGLWRDDLNHPETAYTLQWTIVHHAPTQDAALMTLIDLAEECDALDSCAHELVRVAEQHACPQAKRALRWRAAIIFDEYLGWFELAEQAYASLQHEVVEIEERVRLNRRHAFCLTQLPGRQLEALGMFRAIVADDPFDVATYRGMSSLFGSYDHYDRARVMTQVQRALGDEVEVERTRQKTIPSCSLERAEVLDALLPEGLSRGVLEAIRAAMPLAAKLWSEELPQRKAFENDRRASRELLPVADLFHMIFDALELGRLKVWFGESNPAPVQLLNDGAPLIWLNVQRLDDFEEPELRFLAGYCAALSWAESSSLLHLDGRRLWHLLEGVQHRQTGRGFGPQVDPTSEQFAEELSSPLYAVARRRIVQALDGLEEELATAHCEAWPRALEQFAYRVGLVLCGDVEAAARCILKLQGWRGDLHDVTAQKLIRRHTQLRELLTFTLSEEYLQVRHRLGLAGRPSQIVAR